MHDWINNYKRAIEKRYLALVRGDGLLEKREIIARLRVMNSIITRKVAKEGKYAHTSYKGD